MPSVSIRRRDLRIRTSALQQRLYSHSGKFRQLQVGWHVLGFKIRLGGPVDKIEYERRSP